MTHYLVGYYKPSFEFTRIPEFMAIFNAQGVLLGVTGPSTSRQAALDARLFAAAPELLLALQSLCRTVQTQINRQAEWPEEEYAALLKTLRQAEQLTQQFEHGSCLTDGAH